LWVIARTVQKWEPAANQITRKIRKFLFGSQIDNGPDSKVEYPTKVAAISGMA
jgi:hypothetical protein